MAGESLSVTGAAAVAAIEASAGRQILVNTAIMVASDDKKVTDKIQ